MSVKAWTKYTFLIFSFKMTGKILICFDMIKTISTLPIRLITILTLTLYGADTLAQLTDHSVSWKQFYAKIQSFHSFTGKKNYLLETNHILRDNYPHDKKRWVSENARYPIIRTGSVLFDGIYAMSIQEMVENSVERITDHSFATADCHCFETGRKWNYVWTRDISYSAHLALSSLNQKRTKNSLLFKVSRKRGHDDNSREIVQDTGTGGSWPISTDRVIWALAANDLLNYLTGTEREEFLKTIYVALKNTVEHDRIVAFDPIDGLYTGEQSFLDWREQSYPGWVRDNVIHVGMSKALSTNVAHYYALKTMADVSVELGDSNNFRKYQKLAKNLKQSINKYFWDDDKKLYRTFLVTYLDRSNIDKYDLLGNALAVLLGVAQTQDQKTCLANYPMVLAGPPVMWPQDQAAPIYHNRGIWPFVTQYGLLAAQQNQQARVYNHLFDSMIRGAALNLSNMENFEFLSMNNWLDDGNLSGPVVNSQRQLWSVAGMLSLQLNSIFGQQVKYQKIRFNPFITTKIRNTVFKNTNELTLQGIKFHGKNINVTIKLPATTGKYTDNEFYRIKSATLNGKKIGQLVYYSSQELDQSNHFVIELGNVAANQDKITLLALDNPYQLNDNQFEKIFTPEIPVLYPIKEEQGFPKLYYNTASYRHIYFNIYRNGKLIKSFHNGKDYLDKTFNENETSCYVVEAVFYSSGNKSLHSEPHCYWGKNAIQSIAVTSSQVRTSQYPNYYSDHGKIYLQNWGHQDDVLEFTGFKPNHTGTHALQLNYNNLGYINTGITAAVKLVQVIDESTQQVVTSKSFMMPHHNRERWWIDSNFVTANLEKSRTYTIKISDFYNMSYFTHFESYLYRGGRNGLYNRANISELKVLFLNPQFDAVRF
jgi:hypothetical protein